MKKLISIATVLLLLETYALSGQVPYNFALSQETIDGLPAISPDGRYIAYRYHNEGKRSIELVTADKDSRISIHGAMDLVGFSGDNEYFLYRMGDDSLAVMKLTDKKVNWITGIDGYSVNQFILNKKAYISYLAKNELTILKLSTGESQKVSDVKNYYLNKPATSIVMKTGKGLIWYSVASGKMQTVIENTETGAETFDESGTKFAFFEGNGESCRLMLASADAPHAIELVNARGANLRSDLKLTDRHLAFSLGGTRLYFGLQKIAPAKDKDVEDAEVNVWTYRDKVYPKVDHLIGIGDMLKASNYILQATIVAKAGAKPVLLEDEEMMMLVDQRKYDEYAVIRTRSYDFESYWNEAQYSDFLLVELETGRRIQFIPEGNHAQHRTVQVSKGGKFVCWIDAVTREKWVYDITTGKQFNYDKGVDKEKTWYFAEFWMPGDEYMIVSELNPQTRKFKNDLWLVDPRGIKSSVSLTGGYGQQHNFKFSVVTEFDKESPLYLKGKLLLKATDGNTWDEGYWTVDPAKSNSLTRLVMRPGKVKLKGGAMNSGLFVVEQESASIAPNLFATKDFKSWRTISDLHPEKRQNWINVELQRYTMRDGRPGIMMVYKPQNFDSTRKYPVIFGYYDELSFQFNDFSGTNGAGLYIPAYTSRDYIVAVPDIIHEPGRIAKNVVNALESAADHISAFSWIDSTRMGITGFSFGGYETNVLVANTKRFTCAVAQAGPSNWISSLGVLGRGGNDQFTWNEIGQANLGKNATLWNNLDVYIENSPVFQADKVETPLLMSYGEKDYNVVFSQAVEFFSALRRLNKRAWMISYDEAGHGVVGNDVQIRMQQFFDHYLKDKPAPVWMTRGLPTYLKGLKTGFEPDLEKSCSVGCKSCLHARNAHR